MKVHLVSATLREHPEFFIQFVLPNGDVIPHHFHVTEMGRIEKSYLDCGGIQRTEIACVLQIWAANDIDHRLKAEKLAKIFDAADSAFQTLDLPIMIEYGTEVSAQYYLHDLRIENDCVLFLLAGKQTECKAPDRCGIGECGPISCEPPVVSLVGIGGMKNG